MIWQPIYIINQNWCHVFCNNKKISILLNKSIMNNAMCIMQYKMSTALLIDYSPHYEMISVCSRLSLPSQASWPYLYTHLTGSRWLLKIITNAGQPVPWLEKIFLWVIFLDRNIMKWHSKKRETKNMHALVTPRHPYGTLNELLHTSTNIHMTINTTEKIVKQQQHNDSFSSCSPLSFLKLIVCILW